MILTRPLKMTFPIARMNDSVLVRSIDTFINMIVASERGCCKADPDFGFAFEDFHYAAFSTERAEFFKTLATDTNNADICFFKKFSKFFRYFNVPSRFIFGQ